VPPGLALLLVAAACPPAPSPPNAAEPAGAVPLEAESMRDVRVIAHRGASGYAPENTLAAFRLARALGADAFELDCTTTADGEVVVLHDDTVDRTTNGTGRVDELTLDELRRLDAGTWLDPRFAAERIPTLAEALAEAGDGLGVYVEIKRLRGDETLETELLGLAEEGAEDEPARRAEILARIEASGTGNAARARAVMAVLRRSGAERAIVVQSFSPVICAVVRWEAPELRVELLADVAADDAAAWAIARRWVEWLDLAGLNLKETGATAERIAELHGAGRSTAVWTVDDLVAARRLAERGVDGIITNRPDVVRAALASELAGNRQP
jgi:glycerophosphoryl diester phosphodiesterase